MTTSLTLSFPEASRSDIDGIADDLEAAGIDLSLPKTGALKLPGLHEISVALGGSGLYAAIYHIVQAYLKRVGGQTLKVKTADGFEVQFRGGSPSKIESVLKALTAADGRAGAAHGRKTKKNSSKKRPAKALRKRASSR
jgi:hypothetical protein